MNWVLQMKEFYQSRKSQRLVNVTVMSDQIPMYGSGAGMSTSATGTSTLPVHLSLSFKVRSKANVLGKLVQPKFYKRIDCSVTFDPKKLNVAMSLGKNNCTYN